MSQTPQGRTKSASTDYPIPKDVKSGQANTVKHRPVGPFIEFTAEKIEQSVPARFEKQVETNPDYIAISIDRKTWTYAVLNRAADRVARAVLAACGEGAEPVAFVLERGALPVVALLGILKAGKFYVSLDPAQPQQRLEAILADAEVRLILTDSQNLALARQIAQASGFVVNIEELDNELAQDNLDLAISPDAFAALFYTSGSTGTPKGVIYSQRNMLHAAMTTVNALRIGAADRQPLPFAPEFVWSIPVIFGTLLGGATLYPIELKTLGISGLIEWLIREEITIVLLLPSLLRQIMMALPEPDQHRFPKLRMIVIGGEPGTGADVHLWKQHFAPDCILMHSFGSTEALGIVWYLIDKQSEVADGPLPVGYAAPGREILILDEAGKLLGSDQVGEIAVKSRYTIPGYWRRPALTEAKFLPVLNEPEQRIYLTGDLGRMDADGCLFALGRKDFQVKIRGYTVNLAEVELALQELPGTEQAAASAKSDAAGQNRLIGYLVPGEGHRPTVREVRTALTGKLPDYMMPAAFVFLDTMPLTPNGKVDRKALPEPNMARPDLGQPYLAAQNEIALQLSRMWEDVLQIQPIGIADDFFELGGDSLSAGNLLVAIEKEFGRQLLPSTLLTASTIERLAAILSGEQEPAAVTSLVPLQPHGAAPPFFWIHALGGIIVKYKQLTSFLAGTSRSMASKRLWLRMRN